MGELLEVLRAMDAEPPRPDPPDGWARHTPDIAYRWNGWTVIVFNDAGDWDYIDRVEAPDGLVWVWQPDASDGDALPLPDEVANWQPEDMTRWGRPKDECRPLADIFESLGLPVPDACRVYDRIRGNG